MKQSAKEDTPKGNWHQDFGKAVTVMPVPEVWMDIPGLPCPVEVSNYGRLREHLASRHEDPTVQEADIYVHELEYDEPTDRYGWTVPGYGGQVFVERELALKRFIGIPCLLNPCDAVDARQLGRMGAGPIE